jgi:RNA polymerase sigma-70 factor (sigma-E family)
MGEDRNDAFTAFVDEHGRGLLRTACLLTGDRYAGEDLLQTALAKAYGSWPRVVAAADPPAYVRRILVTTHLGWRRRLLSNERVTEVVPDRGTPDGAASHADRDELRRALVRLPLRMRTAVVLRYLEDLSETETARVMGCSVNTVNNHVSRGLAALRAGLAPAPTPTSGRTA